MLRRRKARLMVSMVSNGLFHFSLSKETFKCFSCRAKGDLLDFVAAMEKCSARDAAQ